jgi:hypothetical protein
MEIRLLVAVFTVLGIVAGLISNYLSMFLFIPVLMYVIAVFPLLKGKKQKDKVRIVQNSLITFVLMWVVVWILLHNLG